MNGAPLHHPDKGQVVERLDQLDRRAVAQKLEHRLAHVRVEVHGVEDLDVVSLRQDGEGLAYLQDTLAEAFAPMAGDENEPLAAVDPAIAPGHRCLKVRILIDAGGAYLQCVDDGVAGNPNRCVVITFLEELLTGALGRAVVTRSHDGGDAPVRFLRKRIHQVAGAKPRLNMTDLYAPMEGSERGGHGRRGVALDQDPGRPKLLEHRINSADNRARDAGERLAPAASDRDRSRV